MFLNKLNLQLFFKSSNFGTSWCLRVRQMPDYDLRGPAGAG